MLKSLATRGYILRFIQAHRRINGRTDFKEVIKCTTTTTTLGNTQMFSSNRTSTWFPVSANPGYISSRPSNYNQYSTTTSSADGEVTEDSGQAVMQSHAEEFSTEQSNTEIATDQLDKLYKTIELEILAYEPAILDSYQWFVVTAASHLNIKVGKCWSPLKSDKLRFSLLKSAFVHKKHQVQYEVRTYHRFITLHKLTGSTADTYLEYIQRNLPEGVGLKVTKMEVLPLPASLQQS